MFFRRMKRPQGGIRFVREVSTIQKKGLFQRFIQRLFHLRRIVETEKRSQKRRGKGNPGTVFQVEKIGQIIAFPKIVPNFVNFCEETPRVPILQITLLLAKITAFFAILQNSLTNLRSFDHTINRWLISAVLSASPR